MTRPDDLDARLGTWLADEAPEHAPRRLRDALETRLDEVPQRSRWLPARPSWRRATSRAGALAQVAFAVGVLLIILLGVAGGGSRPEPSLPPAPSGEASPTPGSAAPSQRPTPVGASLAAGAEASTKLDPRLHFTVPGGWTKTADATSVLVLVPPDAGLMVQPNDGTPLFDNVGVYIDPLAGPADGGPTPERGVGTDAKALSTWLAARPQLMTTRPVAVTVAGLSGYAIDISVSSSAGALCGVRCVNLFNLKGNSGVQFGVFQGEQVRVNILDRSGGGTMLAVLEDVDGVDVASFRALAQQVVESMALEPRPKPSG